MEKKDKEFISWHFGKKEKQERQMDPHLAAFRGDLDHLVQCIEQEKFDVNARDEKGLTLLMIAAFQNHLPVLRYLLGHPDIDTDLMMKDGMTASDLAHIADNKEAAELIEQHATRIEHGVSWRKVSFQQIKRWQDISGEIGRKSMAKYREQCSFIYALDICPVLRCWCCGCSISENLENSNKSDNGVTCTSCLWPIYCSMECMHWHKGEHEKNCSLSIKTKSEKKAKLEMGLVFQVSKLPCDVDEWKAVKLLYKTIWSKETHPSFIVCSTPVGYDEFEWVTMPSLGRVSLLQQDFAFFHQLVQQGVSADQVCGEIVAAFALEGAFDMKETMSEKVIWQLNCLESTGLVSHIPCLQFQFPSRVVKWYLDRKGDPNSLLSLRAFTLSKEFREVFKCPEFRLGCLLPDLMDAGLNVDKKRSLGEKSSSSNGSSDDDQKTVRELVCQDFPQFDKMMYSQWIRMEDAQVPQWTKILADENITIETIQAKTNGQTIPLVPYRVVDEFGREQRCEPNPRRIGDFDRGLWYSESRDFLLSCGIKPVTEMAVSGQDTCPYQKLFWDESLYQDQVYKKQFKGDVAYSFYFKGTNSPALLTRELIKDEGKEMVYITLWGINTVEQIPFPGWGLLEKGALRQCITHVRKMYCGSLQKDQLDQFLQGIPPKVPEICKWQPLPSVEFLTNQILERQISKWIIHKCSICHYPCGFIFRYTRTKEEDEKNSLSVMYDSGCDCMYQSLRPSSLQEVINHIAIQTDKSVVEDMKCFWNKKHL